MEDLRYCKKCLKFKTLDSFYPQYRKYSNKWCKECQNDLNKQIQKNKKDPNWKRSKPNLKEFTKNCLFCNIPFTYRAEHKNVKRDFCGKACVGKNKKKITFETFPDRFWPRVNKEPGQGPNGDCWEWLGKCNDHGYGVTRLNQKSVGAHRAIFMFLNGLLPPSICVCHTCDNSKCVRPDHLFAGTVKENTIDAVTKGRIKRGEDSPSAVLTNEEVLNIRSLASQGFKQQDIAKAFSVNPSTVANIINNKTWRHI